MMRVSELTSENLNNLSKKTGKTKLELMEEAVDLLARKKFFDQVNEGYKKIKLDKKEWKEYQDEMKDWDCTLGDGLDEY